MTERQVTCINKSDRSNRHEKIQYIGGTWGKDPEEKAIIYIEHNIYQYFVQVGGYKANVIIARHDGNKYQKTDRDATTVDNLLSLPECG